MSKTIRTFRFIPDYSPWSGGVWERMVGVLKTSYRKVVCRRKLDYEQFITLVPKLEAIVNSRPLTYLYEDSLEVIRPVDFLLPKADLKYTLGGRRSGRS
uniref:Integrase catalytic domain-containing protein n=1 Tax=Ditylenchus dipsaci TaxID=166011 RepID=A0A915DPD6_9BILA